MIHPHAPSRRAALLATAASLAVATAPAAVRTWDGEGDANWQTAANWDTDNAPQAGDALVFGGGAGLANSNNFAAATMFEGLQFDPGAGAFTISGNSIMMAGNVTNGSANPQSVGVGLTLAPGTITVTGSTTPGAVLALGTITAPAGSAAVFLPNAGTITTANTNTHGILGGWASVGATTNGVDWATVNGSSEIVAYTDYTVVALNATIASDPATNVRVSGDAAVGAGVTDINTLKASTVTGTGGNDISIAAGATLRFGTLGGILHDNGAANNMRIGSQTGGVGNNTLTAGGATEGTPGMLVLDTAATASSHNNVLGLIGTIADNGEGGTVTVVKTGLSSAYFDAGNSYTGGTFINQGHIQGNRGTSFGSGEIRVAPGGQAYLNATATFANDITISGTGLPADNSGAMRFSNATTTGTITLEGDSRVNMNGNATAFINGPVTGPHAFEFYGTGGNGQNTFLVLGNTGNDWGGGTGVTGGPNNGNTTTSTLRLGASEVIPHGPGAGDVTVSATPASTNATARIDLNGFSETINGLNSPVDIRFVVTNLDLDTPVTLTLGENDADGDFGGNLVDSVPENAISLVKNGSGTQIIRGGTSAYYGTTDVNGGTLEFVGEMIADGAITVADGATLAANAPISGAVTVADGGRLAATGIDGGTMELSALTLGTGTEIEVDTATFPAAPIAVVGSIHPTGGEDSIVINVAGTAPGTGQFQLLTYTGTISGSGADAFQLGDLPPRIAADLFHDAGNKALVLDVTAGDFPVWSGVLGTEWSTAVLGAPKNWVLNSNNLTTTDFIAGDAVVFNDSATGNTVDISIDDVAPGSVTFSNDSDAYLLTGSKGIAGATALTMEGDGTTVIANSNSFTGGTFITAGTLQVGNGGTSGDLGTGAVLNEAELAFNRGDDSTFANAIDGFGTVRHGGTGTTTLSGVSAYTGDTIVESGTLRATNFSSFGSLAGNPVQVLAGGAIDIGGGNANNTLDMPGKTFLISGNGPAGDGAIVNVGAFNQQDAFTLISLEADASVGGTARMDLRGGTPELDLNGFTLRKRGTNQFTVVSGLVTDPGQVIVEGGTLALEAATGTPGDGAVTFEAGTQALFYQNNLNNGGVTWPLTAREGVTIGNSGAGLATVPANIVLEGNVSLVGFNGGVPVLNQNRPLTLTGDITENGGSYSVTKTGISVVTLAGAGNSYTGATLVEGGVMVIDGTLVSSPVTLSAGATLGGAGTLGGTLAAAGTVSPGMALAGTLSTGATTLSATATLAIQIDSGALASDMLAVTGALDLGGAMLEVTDLGAAVLAAGEKFTIASYSGALGGAFANAPDGGPLVVGANTFTIDYDEMVLGQTSITLTVAADSAYDEWAGLKGLDGSNNGKLDDPDKDGRANVIEFGLDGDPLSGADDGKSRHLVADVDPGAGVENAFSLTIPVRTGATFSGPGDLVSAEIDGIIYTVQGTVSFLDFTSLNVAEVTPALDADLPALSAGWTYRTFRLPGTPGSPDPAAFLRVDVAESAP